MSSIQRTYTGDAHAPGWVRRGRESKAEYEARLQAVRDLAGLALARLMCHAIPHKGRAVRGRCSRPAALL